MEWLLFVGNINVNTKFKMLISISELNKRWKDGNELMSLLPLLEHSYPDVLEEIETFDSISEETLALLIDYSFRFKSEYWAFCATIWLEKGFPINKVIYKSIVGIRKNTVYSQKTRQKSFFQAIKWQRANDI